MSLHPRYPMPKIGRKRTLRAARALCLALAAAVPLTAGASAWAADTVVTPTARDSFDSTNWTSWGTAPTGGAWTVSPAQSIQSSFGKARLRRLAAGTSADASVGSDQPSDVTVKASIVAPYGLSFAFGTGARATLESDYRAIASVDATGSVTLSLVRRSGAQQLVLATRQIAYRASAYQTFVVELSVVETAAGTSLAGRVYAGTPSAWQLATVDSTGGRPASGTVGMTVTNTGGAREFDMDDFCATPALQAVDPTPTVTPTINSIQTRAARAAKSVTAMYFPPYPVSIDNKPAAEDYYAWGYLSPTGEWNKHAAYGGLLRDRPAPVQPSTDPQWQLRNLETEVRTAKGAGLTGFTLNVLGLGPAAGDRLWDTSANLMKAAENVGGFSVTIMPDLTAFSSATPEEVARTTAALAASPAATRLNDGRILVTPFYAELKDPAWWQTYLDVMSSTYGQRVALMPIFVSDATPLIPKYAPVSYGASVWGVRNPAWNDPADTGSGSSRALADLARRYGLKWMQPVSVQDERPNQGIYDEAENTTNLRNTWALAEATNADSVYIPTWNDYSEGTQLAPSQMHGRTFLDINAYYAKKFRSGTAPAITQDTLYVTHRQQPAAATPTFPQTTLMTPRGGSRPRDTVEVLSFLTAPGQVHVVSGGRTTTCDVPAGVSTCLAPLGTGPVTAELTRAGSPSLSLTSPYAVTANPAVQDLQYVGSQVSRS